jgi:hypothetical protein
MRQLRACLAGISNHGGSIYVTGTLVKTVTGLSTVSVISLWKAVQPRPARSNW